MSLTEKGDDMTFENYKVSMHDHMVLSWGSHIRQVTCKHGERTSFQKQKIDISKLTTYNAVCIINKIIIKKCPNISREKLLTICYGICQ